MKSPTLVCGVPIDDLTLDETVDRIGTFVERGRSTGRTHQVVTVNVDFLVNSMTDPDLLSLLQRAELAVPDGMPVVWGSRLLGSPVRERVAGADLVPALAARSAAAGFSMHLFGAAAGLAAEAAALLRDRHPGLDVSGDTCPRFDRPEDIDPQALRRIRDRAPDILCVALGHPKQEKWIEMFREELGVPVLIGVGGSIDFLVGRKRRAPAWMQRSGTEWVYRTLQEPGRLSQRYARDLVRFTPTLLRELALFRTPAAGESLPPRVHRSGRTTVVRPRGHLTLDAATLGWQQEEWQSPGHGQQVIIDFSDQSQLSHGEFCALVGFAKRLADNGGELSLTSVRPQLAMMLLRLRLYGFLPTTSGAASLPDELPPQTELQPPTLRIDVTPPGRQVHA